ncbi:hypothetical protein ASPCAL11304 [Aspergillus calidoustus]|uniref:Uncharacterized protein n=1 Tax=Aspergillus calidoustus TaxID=454130 RepID=A0A0U5GA50_ASPCI|nr:hypothetical protein ASPCAL11304 [Aspergillus calidoustus]
MPTMAIGSREPGPARWPNSSDVLLSLSLRTDHGDEESLSLSADSLSALSRGTLDVSLDILWCGISGRERKQSRRQSSAIALGIGQVIFTEFLAEKNGKRKSTGPQVPM